jgi:hypothetical protein
MTTERKTEISSNRRDAENAKPRRFGEAQALPAFLLIVVVILSLAPRAAAAVSDEDFDSLKRAVQQLQQQVQQMMQTHDQDQKVHQQDQQQIQQLKEQLGQTQVAVTNAVQKVESAANQIQPIHPVPPTAAATHNFTVVGDAEVQFGKVDGSHSAFALADFAPIFLFRGGDKVLFEAGFDVNLQNNAPSGAGQTTSLGLSFAQLDYLWNDYVTVVGGYMLLPLGTYTERSAGWLNKIPDDPLARAVVPSNGAGVQVRGALPIGDAGQMVTYAVYGANGPGSADGTGNASALDLDGNVGIKSDGSFGNLHGSPSGGGRLGWFYPWKAHWDLELGISGQTGVWDDAGKRLWSASVVDAALHLSPYLELKGEYIKSWVETDDLGNITPEGWWVQGGYKLAGMQMDLPVINNTELVGRYDRFKDGMGTQTDRYTVGFIYYFTNTLLFEGDYEILKSNNPDQAHNELIFQLSYGF